MTRDLFNVLLTAILIVLGLIAFESGTLRGDRGDAAESCDQWDGCWGPHSPEGDRGHWELQRSVKTSNENTI